MSTAFIITVLTGCALMGTFAAGRWVKDRRGWKPVHKQIAGDTVGTLFALSLLAFLEALLQYTQGVSFFDKLRTGHADVVWAIFLAGAIQGIIYEYVGQFTWPAWYYPQARRWKLLLLLLPVFWAIFMLVMQDTWALLRGFGAHPLLVIPIVALIQLALIEGINLYTNSWVYTGRANRMVMLSLGWVLLVLTFVVFNNHFFVNPYGF
jgi:hypothetical protein